MSAAAAPVIRTPDHRLRVFVSSTLQELLPERVAAKAAITELRLSPVMFELGARPHPPRDLYRAYLEQSHIFVGIYWQRYGWVAPDEEVSGLEDEYRLCGDKPKLIYVKHPVEGREARLEELLGQVQTDDTASYKPFGTAEELQQLLADDLALLLTERFEAALLPAPPRPAATPVAEPVPAPAALPRAASPLIGRDAELASLTALLARPEVQLVTLLGAGGIGKSRLALALATAAPAGTATFVDLTGVTDPDAVLPTVAETLGVVDQEGRSWLEGVRQVLGEQDRLLVLDNFEQVVEAAPAVAELVGACPALTVVTTSRTPLRVVAEHEFWVPTLAAPATADSFAATRDAPAVQLFVTRAQAVRASFALTPENAPAVAELTRRLDGLPLALELAASRIKLLPPAAMMRRLDRRFDLLDTGARDLPDRQQTLRATIDWSYNLLAEPERRTLLELAVFSGGWSLEAAEAVCDPAGERDVLDRLGVLVDDSLVVAYETAQDGRFRLLESIKAYALDRLGDGAEAAAVRERHLAYFLALAEQAREELTGADQQTWLVRLEAEHDNLRAALAWARDHPGADDALARLAVALTNYWWIRGHYQEGRAWLTAALDRLAPESPARIRILSGLGTLSWLQGDYPAASGFYAAAMVAAEASGDRVALASAMGNVGIVALEQGDLETASPLLAEALAVSREFGPEIVGPALINQSLALTGRGDYATAEQALAEAVEIFRKLGDLWRLATALINLGEAERRQQELGRAERSLRESLQLARQIEDRESIAYAFEGLASVAAAQACGIRATRLWGAAEALREATGNPRPPASGLTTYEDDVALVRERLGQRPFTTSWAEGRSMLLAEAVAYALQAED
jgi:predicted ATPase